MGRFTLNRDERARRAYAAGPTGALSQANPVRGRDAWQIEVKKRRNLVSDQYWRDKRKLIKEQRLSGRDLRKELRRRKEEAERYYGLNKMKKDNPRLKQKRLKAKRMYGKDERRLERKHDDKWQKTFHDLARGRDAQKKKVLKEMRREYRKSRGLPGQSAMPWR